MSAEKPTIENMTPGGWKELKESSNRRLMEVLGEEYMSMEPTEQLLHMKKFIKDTEGNHENRDRFVVEAAAKEASRQRAQVAFDKEMNRLPKAA